MGSTCWKILWAGSKTELSNQRHCINDLYKVVCPEGESKIRSCVSLLATVGCSFDHHKTVLFFFKERCRKTKCSFCLEGKLTIHLFDFPGNEVKWLALLVYGQEKRTDGNEEQLALSRCNSLSERQ